MTDTPTHLSYFSGLLQSVAERGRALVRSRKAEPLGVDALLAQCQKLLRGRGEASGAANASVILEGYAALTSAERRAFLIGVAERFGPDLKALSEMARAFADDPTPEGAAELAERAEPVRQELIRRLNYAPGGTLALVRLREDLLDAARDDARLKPFDRDFLHLFASWFNRGFLTLQAHRLDDARQHPRKDHPLRGGARDQRLGGSAPPARAAGPAAVRVLPSRARRRAADLRRSRADARDPRRDRRRCWLTTAAPLAPGAATTAVFYSISNAQRGLAGVSFGNFLIKQVVEDLTARMAEAADVSSRSRLCRASRPG